FTLQNLTTSQTVSPSVGTFSFNGAGDQATLVLTNLLPDGNYRVSGAGATLDFFIFAGDANHDRKVNILDLQALASNYGSSGKTFNQGDFNYDGHVDGADLSILVSHWQQTLASPAPAVPGTILSTTSRRTATRVVTLIE